jgi:CheY-like chemotaxis protein
MESKMLRDQQPSPSSSAKPDAAPVGILVVDDEPMIRELALRTLERSGFRALQASSGTAAITLLETHAAEISLVILDLTMPGLSGEQTLKVLQARWPGIRVVLMSGHNVQGMDANYALGAVGYIEKPYLPHELLQVVTSLLRP